MKRSEVRLDSGRTIQLVSMLSVVWFQDDYAFPLSAEADTAIAALAWDSLAREEEL
jgi:hypothetical protein